MLTDTFTSPPDNYRWGGGVFLGLYSLFLGGYIYISLHESVADCSDEYIREWYARLVLFSLIVALSIVVVVANSSVFLIGVALTYSATAVTWSLAENSCRFAGIAAIILTIDYWFHFIVFLVTIIVAALLCAHRMCR